MNGTINRTSCQSYAFYYVLFQALWAGAILYFTPSFNTQSTAALIAASFTINAIFMYTVSATLFHEIFLLQNLRREFAQRSQVQYIHGTHSHSFSLANLSQTRQPIITHCCCEAHRQFGAIPNFKRTDLAQPCAAPCAHSDCADESKSNLLLQAASYHHYPTPNGAVSNAANSNHLRFQMTSEYGEAPGIYCKAEDYVEHHGQHDGASHEQVEGGRGGEDGGQAGAECIGGAAAVLCAVPAAYLCVLCQQRGAHWIMQCPLKAQ